VIPYADGKEKTLIPKKLSGKDDLMGSIPIDVASGRVGRTNN
jgi:hypothetical protein